jgi:small subunit ribosomal protein S1
MEELTGTPNSIDEIKPKDKFTGTVVKIMLAGAAVDIGVGIPGFIHISQLQSEKVNRVEDVLEEGQEVEVWVKRVYPKKDRIELTMIEPLALEWREIKEGMTVKGTIERLEKYGAFVEIGAERPGLVHISELAHGYVRTPSEAVSEGDEVEAKVLSVNRRKKQIKLSMKALMEDPEKLVAEAKKEVEEDNNQPVPTAMEMAIRSAMEKSQQEEVAEKKTNNKKENASKGELEDIYSRTLERKVKTAAE